MTSDAQRIAELERENRELRRANEILKAASAQNPDALGLTAALDKAKRGDDAASIRQMAEAPVCSRWKRA